MESPEAVNDVVLVRNVYHQLRDFHPLYRIRKALKVTAFNIHRMSSSYFNRPLYPTQLHLYEGLDWKHKSRDRKRAGGSQIDGLIHYCSLLERGQEEMLSDHEKISVEGLMYLYQCWYIARDVSIDDTFFRKGPDQLLSRHEASLMLSRFRDNLQKRISILTPQWVALAEQGALPVEQIILESKGE